MCCLSVRSARFRWKTHCVAAVAKADAIVHQGTPSAKFNAWNNFMSRKPVHLQRGDWASHDHLWKGVLEGKDIGTDVTVLFYATEETGKGPT